MDAANDCALVKELAKLCNELGPLKDPMGVSKKVCEPLLKLTNEVYSSTSSELIIDKDLGDDDVKTPLKTHGKQLGIERYSESLFFNV